MSTYNIATGMIVHLLVAEKIQLLQISDEKSKSQVDKSNL